MVWFGAVHCYLQCGAVIPFCGRFWCGFCGLVNTPRHRSSIGSVNGDRCSKGALSEN